MSATSSLLTHLAILGQGRIIHAVLSLAATAVLARALEGDAFGVVVLIHLYLLTVRTIFHARTHAWVVRYGVPMELAKNHAALAGLLVLAGQRDRRAAVLAAAASALGAPLAGVLMGFDTNTIVLVMASSLVLLAGDTGLAMGYLQIRNQTRLLNLHVVAGPLFRVTGALIGLSAKAAAPFFIGVWVLSIAIEHLLLEFAGRRILRRDGISLRDLPPLDPGAISGLSGFSAAARLQGLFDVVPQRLVAMMVAGFLGPGAGGLYRVALEFSSVLSRPALVLRQFVLGPFVRLREQGGTALFTTLLRVLLVTTVASGALTLSTVLFARPTLAVLFGEAFVAAAPLLAWLVAAAAIELSGSALRPAAQALDQSWPIVWAQVAGVLVLVIFQVPLQARFGLEGAGMAALAGAVVHVALAAVIVVRAQLLSQRQT